jgi:hypothetical protein
MESEHLQVIPLNACLSLTNALLDDQKEKALLVVF